jgi:hypothetical protein
VDAPRRLVPAVQLQRLGALRRRLITWVGTRTVYNNGDACHGEDLYNYGGYEYLCTCDVLDIIDDNSVTPALVWTVAEKDLTFLEASLKALGHAFSSPRVAACSS